MGKKRRCPFCGKRIPRYLNKCNHCGKSLNDNSLQNIVENTNNEEEVKINWGKSIGKLIVYAIIFFIAYSTVPSKETQYEKVKNVMVSRTREHLSQQLSINRDYYVLPEYRSIVNDDDALFQFILEDAHWEIDNTNFLVLSAIEIKEKDTGKSSIIGIAAFGIVYLFDSRIPDFQVGLK